MNVLLISSANDEDLARRLVGALESAEHSGVTCFPDRDQAAALPAYTRHAVQTADYFIYLVTRHTRNAPWINRLTPSRLAPLCAAGLRFLLMVFKEGSPPENLACLPCLYFLDGQTAPALVDRWVVDLGLVHALQPDEIALLRYSIRDLEAFLETAQALSFAYTGLEAAWDGLPNKQALEGPYELSALVLFRRYAASIHLEQNRPSRERLGKLVSQQPGGGVAEKILHEYQALESDWLEIEKIIPGGLAGDILPMRTRAAAFINLVFLVLSLQLLPYCEHYLHMHGLKQQQDRRLPHDQPADPAQARLAFLIEQLG